MTKIDCIRGLFSSTDMTGANPRLTWPQLIFGLIKSFLKEGWNMLRGKN